MLVALAATLLLGLDVPTSLDAVTYQSHAKRASVLLPELGERAVGSDEAVFVNRLDLRMKLFEGDDGRRSDALDHSSANGLSSSTFAWYRAYPSHERNRHRPHSRRSSVIGKSSSIAAMFPARFSMRPFRTR